VQSSLSYMLGTNVENLTLTGTAAVNGTGNSLANTLTGNSAANILTGGAGDDIYVVGAGDSIVEQLNEGTDTVSSAITWTLGANVENLTLTGAVAISGTGNSLSNMLTGNSAANVLDADGGDDTLNGGAGADTLFGGTGNDTYVVDNVGDVVTEQLNEGLDTVQSSVSYTLSANVENLTLTGTGVINATGNSLTNTLTGTSGANVLDGGTGVDTLIGGAGNDTYVVDDAGDVVRENLNEGTDTVQSAISYTLGVNAENLMLTGIGAINATGNSANNVLTGNSGNNLLDGGGGTDTLRGGLGDDAYVVDDAGDVVRENLNEGTDTVQSAISYTLGANVENLILTGSAALTATGNTLNNVLVGNSAANTLNGGTGADQLAGGAGNDTYVVDNVGDVVTEQLNEGLDTVQSSVTYALAANVDNLTLTGAAAINATGNSLANILTGNAGANVLDGGVGADTLVGGAGNDAYVVEDLGDVVTEQLNQGTDTVQSAISYTLGINLENLTLTGTAALTGTGNTLNNVLTGTSAANVLTGDDGNDTLDGGAGADTLIGGLGNDTYLVDNGSDVVAEQLNEGTDTVLSAVTYTLAANVENLTLTGTAASDGTGNALANTLRGNSAANVLTGGAGNDIYVVSTGDAVVENAAEGTDTVQSDITWTLGANLENLTLTGTAASNGTGNSLNNTLRGNSATNELTGGAGNDTYVVSTGDTILENANEGTDTAQSDVTWTLGANIENLTLTGTAAINATGNSLANTLTGNAAANQLAGGLGNDTLRGVLGNDTYLVNRGEGQDLISENDGTVGNSDQLLYGATINPLDLVLSRQANDLRLAIHGSTDYVTVQNWYSTPTTAQVETIQAGNGQALLSTQVDQLIQAMAGFTAQTGLTWDQAIDQRPQEVQTVLAASWQ
jgi:Ca2+-binding RTX toxin-like protein